jgi:L-threonylcarbamoyladenylate synthase
MNADSPHELIDHAAAIIKSGGIIAYPTEAVFGLGCDPFNQKAVERLLEIKRRPSQKGLILIAANWNVLEPLVQMKNIEPAAFARVQATWPGPFTWIFPANNHTPEWVCSPDHTIALRVTAHPIARTLCAALNAPLVSTSANFSNSPPLRDAASVQHIFGETLDYVLSGDVDHNLHPSEIRDVLTGNILRQ